MDLDWSTEGRMPLEKGDRDRNYADTDKGTSEAQKLGRFFPRTFRHLWESISLVVIYSFVAICYGNPKETNISMTFHKFTIKNCLRFIFSSILLLFPTVGSREVGTKHGWKKVTSYADWIRLNSESARSDKPLAGSAMYSISLINSYKITFTFPKG